MDVHSIHFFVTRTHTHTRFSKLTAQTWQVVVCSGHLKRDCLKKCTHISTIITPTTWQELFTVAPKICVKMTVLQTVLIIANTDNSLWKHQPFLSLLRDINIQYSLENAYEDMQVWVCVHAHVNTIFVLLQEDNLCITMRCSNEISHQPAIHTY